MPVSESCTVRHTRSSERAARASTAMTQAGLVCLTTARISSPLSSPVVPRTPAATAVDRAEGAELPGQLLHQVPGDQRLVRRPGPHGVPA